MADGLNIIPDYVGGDYGRTATANAQPFNGIVVHVTGRPTLQSELDYMSKPDPNRPGQYGYHFLVDRDGQVYQTAPFDVRTNHILPANGFSNNNSLGVAFVGADKGTTPQQMTSGRALVGQLQSQFNIAPDRVVSHGELDPATRGAGKGLNPEGGSEGQDFITAWRGGTPAPTATASAQPSRPVSATPGTTLNTSPMDLVANVESGNQNVPQRIHDINTEKGTPAGGFFQIIDPTWRTYGAKAGVDLNQYPTAMSAPRNVQAQVASAIPVNQWGANTVAALKKQYPWIDTSQTLGQVQSAALGGNASTAVASATPAATPSAGAGGGAVLPGFADAKTSNAFLQNLDQFDKSLGGRGLGLQGQGQGEGQGQPDIRPSPLMPGAGTHNVSSPQSIGMTAQQMLPGLTHYQPQPYGQTLNSDPLAIGAGTPQQPDWLKNAGLQQAAQPSPYGTSIGSMQMAYGLSPQQLQMLMNPMMLNQSGGFS